jgi:hypothetical protein
MGHVKQLSSDKEMLPPGFRLQWNEAGRIQFHELKESRDVVKAIFRR